MSLFDNPTFWEYVAGIIIVVASMPVAYLLFIMSLLVYAYWKNEDGHGLTMDDPVFGTICYFKSLGYWEGEVKFHATDSHVMITIEATELGPTEEQKSFFRKIDQNYKHVLPEIHKALREYTESDWEFELGLLSILDATHSENWYAEYTEKSDEEGHIGYIVDIANWNVEHVTGCD